MGPNAAASSNDHKAALCPRPDLNVKLTELPRGLNDIMNAARSAVLENT